MKITSVKGFRDILPQEAARRRHIVSSAVRVLEAYGYEQIELPLLEKVDLFSRSVGQTTDIVEKEMYAFEDRDGTMVALRPEGTASVARAYVEAGLMRSMPVARFYYEGPMFRRERPQKGRFRQFSQIGAEFLGRDDPEADAETICLVADICHAVGVADFRIEINSLGDESCRPRYRDTLATFAKARTAELCEECGARVDRNPLRLLDCKNEACRAATMDAPMVIDHLCDGCRVHHERVLELVAAAGVEVFANARMVRGLDYYCRTAFEVLATGLGAQDAVGGGGRYDRLVADLGGSPTPGIGFAFGIDRLDLASTGPSTTTTPPDILIAPLGAGAAVASLRLARRLRAAGRRVELGPSERRLKAQLKRADKAGIRYVLIVGEDEISSGRATLRDMVERRDRVGCVALDAPAAEIFASIEKDDKA